MVARKPCGISKKSVGYCTHTNNNAEIRAEITGQCKDLIQDSERIFTNCKVLLAYDFLCVIIGESDTRFGMNRNWFHQWCMPSKPCRRSQRTLLMKMAELRPMAISDRTLVIRYMCRAKTTWSVIHLMLIYIICEFWYIWHFIYTAIIFYLHLIIHPSMLS